MNLTTELGTVGLDATWRFGNCTILEFANTCKWGFVSWAFIEGLGLLRIG